MSTQRSILTIQSIIKWHILPFQLDHVYVLLNSKALSYGSRLKPENVNGHPWSLGMDSQTKYSIYCFEIKYWIVWCKHLFKFHINLSLRDHKNLCLLCLRNSEAKHTGRGDTCQVTRVCIFSWQKNVQVSFDFLKERVDEKA